MSGDDARVAYPLFQADEGGSSPTSPLQLQIVPIGLSRAKKLNQLWHSRLPLYETGFCETAKICFGALYGNIFYAVGIWNNPSARLLPHDTHLELKRMAIAPDAPKFTASRMLKIMALLISRIFLDITVLISYQDEEVHKGTIYKAAGWKPINRHSGDKWDRPGRYRPDLQKSFAPKIRWEKRIDFEQSLNKSPTSNKP